MTRHVLNRCPVLVLGLILWFASAAPSLGSSDESRLEKDATIQSLSERFTLSETRSAEPHSPVDVYSLSAVVPAVYSRAVRLETDLPAAGGQTTESPGSGKRTKFSGELGIGYAAYTTKGIGGGVRYGLSVLSMVSPRIGLEFVLERLIAPVDGETDPLGLGEGTLHTTPLTVNLQYRWPGKGRFTPYALLGVGFYFMYFEPEDGKNELDDRVSLSFGGGLDTRIGRNVALHTGLRFAPVPTWVQGKCEGDVNPDEQDKFWLNAAIFTVGIKYFFN